MYEILVDHVVMGWVATLEDAQREIQHFIQQGYHAYYRAICSGC
jgi:hypothetical protein